MCDVHGEDACKLACERSAQMCALQGATCGDALHCRQLGAHLCWCMGPWARGGVPGSCVLCAAVRNCCPESSAAGRQHERHVMQRGRWGDMLHAAAVRHGQCIYTRLCAAG
jgi:hypothetical protein